MILNKRRKAWVDAKLYTPKIYSEVIQWPKEKYCELCGVFHKYKDKEFCGVCFSKTEEGKLKMY